MDYTNLRESVRSGALDLRTLNSLTKYPSIETYHVMEPGTGRLTEEVRTLRGEVELTEKIDGTNARIVVMPCGSWVIGSREELLGTSGDLLPNAKLGIVDALRDLADDLSRFRSESAIVVHYGEVYGHGIGGAAREYAPSGEVGFRMFDTLDVPSVLLRLTPGGAASWRGSGRQPFPDAEETARRLDGLRSVVPVERVPRVDRVHADVLPTSVEATREWLGDLVPRTAAPLGDGARGRAEGVVLRGVDETGRRRLLKARFEDYDRTLRRRRLDAAAGRSTPDA